MQRRQCRLFWLFAFWRAQISLSDQFFSDLGQLACRFRTGNLVKYRIEVLQFRFAFLKLFGEECLGIFGFLIILVIFLRIRGRGDGGI